MPLRPRFKKAYVEISNICNLQCDFCPEVERDKAVMTPALFTKVIGELAGLTEEVCFHLMGEPLSHPRFSDFVALCASRGLAMNITTNGTLLDQARTTALLSPLVRQVNFSLHSFEANFGEKDILSYMNKIFAFTRLARERRPDLYINYRLWNLAPGSAGRNPEILGLIEREFGCGLSGDVDVRAKKNRQVAGRVFMHFDTAFRWPHLEDPARGSRGFCHALSAQIGILADGTVVPCCLDKEAGVPLGNCAGKSLVEVLAGERAAAMKAGFAKNELVEDLCRRCTFISRFDGRLKEAVAGPPR